MIFSQFSLRLLSLLKDAFLSTAAGGLKIQKPFKVSSALELKPEAIAPWERTFVELGTVPTGLLSRATCCRYGIFCMNGFICFFDNDGGRIYTKTI